jgi:hypothetical protein
LNSLFIRFHKFFACWFQFIDWYLIYVILSQSKLSDLFFIL